MTRQWRKRTFSLICMMIFISGCSLLEADPYTDHQIGDRTIKVLDNPNDVVYNQFILEKVERYPDLRGMDWLNEEEVLVVASHKQTNPLLPMGGESNWRNLFLFDTNSKQKKLLLAESNITHGSAHFSPDKRTFYFEKYNGDATTGHFMDVATKKVVEVIQDQEYVMDKTSISWKDPNKMLIHTFHPSKGSRIEEIETSGKRSVLVSSKQGTLVSVSGKGNMIYYIMADVEGEFISNSTLYSFHTQTKEIEEIDNKVERVVLSPDGDKLAIIKRMEETKRNLMIIDLTSKKRVKVAEGEGVYGIDSISWSPNQRYIAYSTISYNKKGKRGLFIADVNQGKSTQISVDFQEIPDPIRWSPSGRKLLISQYEYNKKQKQIPYLYVITLSTKSPSR